MIALIIVLVVVLSATAGFAFLQGKAKDTIRTENLSVPLNGAKAAKMEINAGSGNLSIDPMTGGETLLVGGTAQYGEKQGAPSQSIIFDAGRMTFSIVANRNTQRPSALPWAACNGATEWKLLLAPGISSEITVHSDGGNIDLNLAGMTVTRVQADTSGGNIDLALPDAAGVVSAKTGAGNVNVSLPAGVAARITVTTGLGKAIIAARYTKIDEHTYQSPDYETATKKVDLTLQSGAGNVSVK